MTRLVKWFAGREGRDGRKGRGFFSAWWSSETAAARDAAPQAAAPTGAPGGAEASTASTAARPPALPRSPYAGLAPPAAPLNSAVADELLSQAARLALRTPAKGPRRGE